MRLVTLLARPKLSARAAMARQPKPPTITETGGGGSRAVELSGGIPVRTTQPDFLLRHNISDEELTMLQKSRSDEAWEMTLAAGGAAVGAAPQVLRDLFNAFYAKNAPLDWVSVIG